MTQGKTTVLLIVVLVIGFGAGFLLRPIIAPPAATAVALDPKASMPQSSEEQGVQYFVANVEDARQVVAGCVDGSVRGAECANAEEALIKVDAEGRRRRFLGD